MSSYAELTLGTLSLAASRNGVDPDLIWLFRQSDKTVERIDQRNPKQLAKYIMEEYIEQYDKNNPFTCVEYRCSAAQARDRLDLKGFTREVAESGFKAGLRNEIERLRKSQTLFNSSRDVFSPNPPKDTDGRREDSGRGWVRELQGRWPGVLG